MTGETEVYGIAESDSASDDTKANVTLDNLGTTAVNTDVLPDFNDQHNLGDATHRWNNVFAAQIDSIFYDYFNLSHTFRTTVFSNSTLTANYVIKWPEASGNVLLDTNTATVTNKIIDGDNNTITNVGSGPWNYLRTETLSAVSEIEFTDLTKSDYYFEFRNITPSVDLTVLRIVASNDNGSTYDTSGVYQWTFSGMRGATANTGGDSEAVYMQIQTQALGTDTREYGFSGDITLAMLNSSVSPAKLWGNISYSSSNNGDLVSGNIGGMTSDGSAGTGDSLLNVNAIKLFISAGTMTGSIRIYESRI